MNSNNKEFIKKIVMLSILCILNVFMILVAKVPALNSIKEGTNLLIRFIYFGTIVLYIAVINVDSFIKKEKKIIYIIVFYIRLWQRGLMSLLFLGLCRLQMQHR